MYNYETIFPFYETVCKLCKPNQYNLVLHKHLGDVFYAIGLKDEFERIYKKKLHFIVRPQHEFLMNMYGIKNYSVCDLDKLVKNNFKFKSKYFGERTPAYQEHDWLENNMFQLLFNCVPVPNMPFVCETPLNNFFTYNHYYCHRWGSNLGIREDFKFSIPSNNLTLSTRASKVIQKLGPLHKIVLFAPEAATATELPSEFWNAIADVVHQHGYTIIVNSKKYKINHGISAFDLGLSLQDVVALGLNCAYVFSLRSGLCDVLVGAQERLYAVYPAMLKREMYSLQQPFDINTGVKEFLLTDWAVPTFVWENENLTPKLQKVVDKLHRVYLKEKILSCLTRGNKRKEHKFWYHLFRDIFDKSTIFPNNNSDMPCPVNVSYTTRGLLYTKIVSYDDRGRRDKRKNFLFGLGYYKSNIFGRYLSIFGLPIWQENRDRTRILSFTVYKSNWQKKWLANLQSQIDPKYDDIYIMRHNIGETYVELLSLKDRIKVNKSKHPLLVVWNKKYIELYKMFLPSTMDIQYIPLIQSDIHSVFAETRNNYRDIVIKKGHQRFFCSTPRIVENMTRTETTNNHIDFWSYILESCHLSKNAPTAKMRIPNALVKKVDHIVTELKLKKKFVILAPEAKSMIELPNEFWQKMADICISKNYDVFVNANLKKISIKGVKNTPVNIEELLELSRRATKIITMGSGLAVLLTTTGTPMDIIYTQFKPGGIECSATKVIDLYSVFYLPNVSKNIVTEYNTEKITLNEILESITNQLATHSSAKQQINKNKKTSIGGGGKL